MESNYSTTKNSLLAAASERELSERTSVKKALRESEERLGAILNTAADAIITIDRGGIINRVNPATEKIFGYTQDELVGQNVKILMPQPDRDHHDGYITRYLATGSAHIIGRGREVTGERKDGSRFPMDLTISEVNHLGLFTGIIRDITERKELQKQVLKIAADEDRRIAQELHDGIQQEVTGLELFAGSLRTALDLETTLTIEGQDGRFFPESDFQRIRSTADAICNGLAETHAHLQQLCYGILPVQIDAQGLSAALARLANSIDKLEEFSCTFDSPQIVEVVDNTTANHLYRIAQEAINNALRHSRGNKIWVALLRQNEQIILQVSDNGSGMKLFPETDQFADASEAGIGIHAMQYRADLIGASLQIGPGKDGGTRVRCVVLQGRT